MARQDLAASGAVAIAAVLLKCGRSRQMARVQAAPTPIAPHHLSTPLIPRGATVSDYSSGSESASSDGGVSEFQPNASESDSEVEVVERPQQRGPMRGARAPAPLRRPAAAAPAGAPAPKRARASAQPKLTDLLHTASKHQLEHLIMQLISEVGGELEGRIVALLPPPDLEVGAGRAGGCRGAQLCNLFCARLLLVVQQASWCQVWCRVPDSSAPPTLPPNQTPAWPSRRNPSPPRAPPAAGCRPCARPPKRWRRRSARPSRTSGGCWAAALKSHSGAAAAAAAAGAAVAAPPALPPLGPPPATPPHLRWLWSAPTCYLRPTCRWGNNQDAYAYKRVGPPLRVSRAGKRNLLLQQQQQPKGLSCLATCRALMRIRHAKVPSPAC